MTLVHIDLTWPSPAGERPACGRVQLTPTLRRTLDSPARVVLPHPVSVDLTEGRADVELAATSPAWCWRAVEYVAGGTTRHVAVPDVPEVAYADLPDVDPATLDPAATPEPAWWAALETGAYGITATPDAEPGVLRLRFPVWRTDPADQHVLLMPVTTPGARP